MKKIIRKFLKRFGYVHVSEIKDDMTLLPFNDDGEIVHRERGFELYMEAQKAVMFSKNTISAYIEVSKVCKHKNELAWAVAMVHDAAMKKINKQTIKDLF